MRQVSKLTRSVTQTLFIAGPLPGMNEILDQRKRGGGGNSDGYSRLKLKWSQLIGWAIREQRIKPVVSASFDFEWVEPTRRRDPDNIDSAKKFIFDAFVDHGILANDGWDDVLGPLKGWSCSFVVGKPAGVTVQMTGELAGKDECSRRWEAQAARQVYRDIERKKRAAERIRARLSARKIHAPKGRVTT